MLSSFTAPLQNWETPQLSELKKFPQLHKIKSSNTSNVTQKDLDNLVSFSKNYFSKKLKAQQFRLRLPHDDIADLDDCVDKSYQDIRNSVSQSFILNRQQTPQYALRHIAIAMRNKNYDEVTNTVDRLYKENYQCFAAVYSFLASIIKGNYASESNILHLMEHLPYPANDLPHFYHFLDELSTLPNNQHVLLTSLLLQDTQSLAVAFKHEPHVLPLLSSKISMHYRQDPMREPRIQQYLNQGQNQNQSPQDLLRQREESLKVKNIFRVAEYSSQKMPKLIPAIDMPTPPIIPSEQAIDKSAVPLNILTNQFGDAIKLASTFIEKGENLADMYMYRAIAYMRIDQIPAAIMDLNRSIELESTDEKLRARAACWLIAGEPDLALIDITDNKANEDIKDIVNALSPIYTNSYISKSSN